MEKFTVLNGVAAPMLMENINTDLIAPSLMPGRSPEDAAKMSLQGKMFAKYLRDELAFDTNCMPAYLHEFEDGRQPVWPKAYPNELLPTFRSHFTEVWMPKRALEYFQDKDPKAIPYLKQVLGLPSTAPTKVLAGSA